MTQLTLTKCPGFDTDGRPFPCDGTPGTPWTPVWCPACDERRRTRLDAQFKALAASVRGGSA